MPSKNTTYCYKDSVDFVIENGVLKGTEDLFVPEHSNYGEMILERFRANPEFVGQIDGITGRKETLAEMTDKSVKCAMWLKQQNIQPGDVIGICTHNHMDTYVPFLASLYIGAVFNSWWDSGLTKEIARHFVTLTKPKILFIHEASLAVALEVVQEMGVQMKFVIFGSQPGLETLDEILSLQDTKFVNKFRCIKLSSLDEPAFIVYTAGTTGLPKGIVTTHKSIFGNSPNFIKLGELRENVRSINFSSISWGLGIACLLRAVVVPETRVIYPEFHLEIAQRLIEKFKINLMHLSPSNALKLQKSPALQNYDLSSLKLFWISGGVMRKEMQSAIAASFPRASVYQAYGSSELGGVAFRQTPGFKPGSCGTITRNISMKVIEPTTGRILGPNEPGEACFKSPFAMNNYLNNPKATRKTIDPKGWLHSGDLVHYDEEGHVFVTDRVSEMINYKGHLISPETIEQTMKIYPGISDIAVVSIPDREDGQHPVAFVTKTPDSKITEEELEKLMALSIPDGKKIRGGIKFIEAIPRLLSGKVARANLKNMAKFVYALK